MIWKLTKRNILVFVRNGRLLLLSAVSVFLIIALFALFLGRMYSDWVTGMFGSLAGVRWLVDSWIIAGVLEINTAVVALYVLGTMVNDTESRRLSDFITAPLNRSSLVISHFLAALAVGFVYSLVGLLAGEAYIVLAGGQWLNFANHIRIIGMLALCVLSSASVMFFIVTFIKSVPAYNTFSSLMSTFIGFLACVYIPVGVFPDAAQRFVAALPFGLGSAALRRIFCSQPLEAAFVSAPPQTLAQFEKMYGIRMYWGGAEITLTAMLAALAGTAALFMVLSALRLKRYKQT